MDPTVSGLGAQGGLIERNVIERAAEQSTQAASESRQLRTNTMMIAITT